MSHRIQRRNPPRRPHDWTVDDLDELDDGEVYVSHNKGTGNKTAHPATCHRLKQMKRPPRVVERRVVHTYDTCPTCQRLLTDDDGDENGESGNDGGTGENGEKFATTVANTNPEDLGLSPLESDTDADTDGGETA